jgi:repressor LexA
MRDKLPRRQEETLDHIIAYVREHGHAPSIRDLCTRMNVSSPATVHGHLRALAERGLISMPTRQSRSIILSPYESGGHVEESVPVPLVSALKGGTRVLERANWDAQIPLPTLWLGRRDGNEWLLRVTSEIAAEPYHIGDYLLLRATTEAPHDGEIVALPQRREDGEADGAPPASTRIVLQAFTRGENRPVLGRVAGLFRPPL